MSSSSDTFPFATIPLQEGEPPIAGSESEVDEYNARRAERKRCDRLVPSMLTPEHAQRMAELARTCLTQGDLQRGIQAIALAVAVDPGRADRRDVLDRYMDEVDRDEATLMPDMASPWFLFNPPGRAAWEKGLDSGCRCGGQAASRKAGRTRRYRPRVVLGVRGSREKYQQEE